MRRLSGAVSTSAGKVDAFSDLLGTGGATAASQPSFPSITAFEKDGILVTFSFSKSQQQPATTDITATYSNNSDQLITDFSLQVGPCSVAFQMRLNNQDTHLSLSRVTL